MNSSVLTLEDVADANFNIIVKIYQLLDFVDQLRLAQASPWLKQIFRAKIWTASYKTLTVNEIHSKVKIPADTRFFYVYEINGTCICLNPTELSEFLAFYANDITELIACDHYFPDLRNFKNITGLKYIRGTSGEKLLETVTENCLNLQSLEVILSFIRFNIDYLLKLRHLKILALERCQYEQFCSIIRNLNLECLRIKNIEVNVPEIIHVETPKFLTELYIRVSDSRLLGWNYNIFENLLKLHLNCYEIMNDNDWNTFCKAAKRLEVITMEGLRIPETMEIINLPTSLKQVNIKFCLNLRDQHLTQIFHLPNLLKFSSIGTNYLMADLFNYAFPPPQLESLNCEKFNTFDLLTSIASNQNLEELTWYSYKENSDNEDNRLLFCKSLKTLNVDTGTLASAIILRMENLCKLSLGKMAVFKWSDVIALLKHPVLKEFYIETAVWKIIEDESSVKELEEGFPINLSLLSIPSRGLELNLNFWLDLLCQNLSRLKLMVDSVKKNYLREIFGHKKFPKRKLKTITYGDFIVDCKTLDIKIAPLFKDSAVVPALTLVLCN